MPCCRNWSTRRMPWPSRSADQKKGAPKGAKCLQRHAACFLDCECRLLGTHGFRPAVPRLGASHTRRRAGSNPALSQSRMNSDSGGCGGRSRHRGLSLFKQAGRTGVTKPSVTRQGGDQGKAKCESRRSTCSIAAAAVGRADGERTLMGHGGSF
jgi:hypothetical protein